MTDRSFNWTHLVSCLLVGVTAVLLSFGALVTTYEAAMAVPDWPATYGHNMFLFPWQQWLHGPWDLFLEHGHRLLGAAAGLVTIALVAVAWRGESGVAVRWLAVAALLLVLLQGALGGARVLLDDKTVAKVHACTGPLFFAVAVAIATLSRRPGAAAGRGSESRLPAALLVTAYLQLVAGAQLRHLDATVDPALFRGLVGLHVLGAVAVTVLSFVTAAMLGEDGPPVAKLWARLLVATVVLQVLLGVGAWVVNWGLPPGIVPETWQPAVPLMARGVVQASVVTAHVILGMLLLAGAVVVAIEAAWPAAAARSRLACGRPAAERAFA